MLNRRQIRVRAMQSLYAYKQADAANFSLALDQIAENFAPNLNSMEYQDKVKLEGYTKLGQLLLQEAFSRKNKEDKEEKYPQNVLTAVEKAREFYIFKSKKDMEHYGNRCMQEAEKVYDLYLSILSLFLEIAERGIADKINNNFQLSDNQLLKKLKHDKSYELLIIRKNINWTNEQPLISKIYREGFLANEPYQKYCSERSHTIDDDFAILKYLLKNVLLKHEITREYFEKQNLYWEESIDTIRAMVSHTFQSGLTDDIKIETLDEDWQESKDFLQTLFSKSIIEAKELEKLLLPKLKNWEMERIAETDQILLKMALVEIMNYPSIPTKVTINETIEIAKEYSTPKSGQFINGILDILSKELQEKGTIRKSDEECWITNKIKRCFFG